MEVCPELLLDEFWFFELYSDPFKCCGFIDDDAAAEVKITFKPKGDWFLIVVEVIAGKSEAIGDCLTIPEADAEQDPIDWCFNKLEPDDPWLGKVEAANIEHFEFVALCLAKADIDAEPEAIAEFKEGFIGCEIRADFLFANFDLVDLDEDFGSIIIGDIELPIESVIDCVFEMVVDSKSDETPPYEFLYLSPPNEAANVSFRNEEPYGLIDGLKRVFALQPFLNSLLKLVELLSWSLMPLLAIKSFIFS